MHQASEAADVPIFPLAQVNQKFDDELIEVKVPDLDSGMHTSRWVETSLSQQSRHKIKRARPPGTVFISSRSIQ